MCARYTMTLSLEELVSAYGLIRAVSISPRFNIAPSQLVPAVRANAEREMEMDLLRWGLIPRWAKDPSIGARLFNARSETVAEKPSFRAAFRFRRCLMPADGFYEWQATNGRKRPIYVRLRDGEPFAFAALWERWEPPEGEPVESCALLTTEPNELMRQIHDRMPVILREGAYERWMDSETSVAALSELFRPIAADLMEAVPVGAYVNNPRNEGPECIRPVT